jgi:hypothetical protein
MAAVAAALNVAGHIRACQDARIPRTSHLRRPERTSDEGPTRRRSVPVATATEQRVRHPALRLADLEFDGIPDRVDRWALDTRFKASRTLDGPIPGPRADIETGHAVEGRRISRAPRVDIDEWPRVFSQCGIRSRWRWSAPISSLTGTTRGQHPTEGANPVPDMTNGREVDTYPAVEAPLRGARPIATLCRRHGARPRDRGPNVKPRRGPSQP